MKPITEGLRGVLALFSLSAQLFAAHWPTLLALYFAGAAGRMAALWLALLVSKSNALLATLLVPLAPVATLISVVLMLRVCAGSLPALRGESPEGSLDTHWKANLRVAAQVLVPFLAVYASQGLLHEDSHFFIYGATADEVQNNFLGANFGRTVYASEWGLLALVLVAMGLRKWISLRRLTEKSVAWGLFGGYLEAFWLVALSAALAKGLGALSDWVTSRALIDRLLVWPAEVSAAPGLIPQVIGWVFTRLAEMLGQMGNLIILPVAWLATGALIFGGRLSARRLPVHGLPASHLLTHEQVTERLRRIPNPVQRFVAQTLEPITTPIQNTVTAASKVASPGLLKMVFYCVAFALAGSGVKLLVSAAARTLMGPRAGVWLEAAEPYVLLLERGAHLTLCVVMVAAAVSHILATDREQQANSAPGSPTAEPTTGPTMEPNAGETETPALS